MQIINTSLEMNDIFGGGELTTTVALTSTEIEKFMREQKHHISYEELSKLPSRYLRNSEDSKKYIDNDRKTTCDFIKSYMYGPRQVIFNGPATIVIWNDNTKTIVKRREGEPDDKEKAVMYCVLKKLCGNKAAMDKYLKLFLKEELNNEEKA